MDLDTQIEKNKIINLIFLFFIGNVALITLYINPETGKNVEIIKTICFMIIFAVYYIISAKLTEHYINRLSPYLTKKIKKHPIATKRISALFGMFVLFLILSNFMDRAKVLEIYGIGFVTYLLSFLVPSK
mgnify:CR=1 FL=1